MTLKYGIVSQSTAVFPQSVENVVNTRQERSQKGDCGCASEKLGVPHLLSD